MAAPVKTHASVWHPDVAIQCRQHGVAVTSWADYSYWCDTHNSHINVELTTKRSA